MAETDVSRVKMIASHIENLENEKVEMYISDAELELEDLDFDDKYREKLERYLAAHYATIDIRREKSKKMEDMQKTYETASVSDRSFLETTQYGQEVVRILEKAKGVSFALIS